MQGIYFGDLTLEPSSVQNRLVREMLSHVPSAAK